MNINAVSNHGLPIGSVTMVTMNCYIGILDHYALVSVCISIQLEKLRGLNGKNIIINTILFHHYKKVWSIEVWAELANLHKLFHTLSRVFFGNLLLVHILFINGTFVYNFLHHLDFSGWGCALSVKEIKFLNEWRIWCWFYLVLKFVRVCYSYTPKFLNIFQWILGKSKMRPWRRI